MGSDEKDCCQENGVPVLGVIAATCCYESVYCRKGMKALKIYSENEGKGV